MNYQIEVSEIKDRNKKTNQCVLKTCVPIRDAAYWQKRINKLMPGVNAAVVVAK